MELVTEFADFCLQLAFWYMVGSIVLGFIEGYLRTRTEEIHTETREILKELNEIIHRVRVEEHGDMVYWFDDDNDTFLAQGTSIEQATEQLRARFPNHVFFISSKSQIYKISAPDWTLTQVN
jgi:hypothetical protein